MVRSIRRKSRKVSKSRRKSARKCSRRRKSSYFLSRRKSRKSRRRKSGRKKSKVKRSGRNPVYTKRSKVGRRQVGLQRVSLADIEKEQQLEQEQYEGLEPVVVEWLRKIKRPPGARQLNDASRLIVEQRREADAAAAASASRRKQDQKRRSLEELLRMAPLPSAAQVAESKQARRLRLEAENAEYIAQEARERYAFQNEVERLEGAYVDDQIIPFLCRQRAFGGTPPLIYSRRGTEAIAAEGPLDVLQPIRQRGDGPPCDEDDSNDGPVPTINVPLWNQLYGS